MEYSYFPSHYPAGPVYPIFAPAPPPIYKLPKRLLGLWISFDLLLLAAGIAFAALSISWLNVDAIHRMVMTQADIFMGLFMGGAFIVTFMLSMPSLLQSLALAPTRVLPTHPLVRFIGMLFVDEAIVIAAGTVVWWRTLQERIEFSVPFDQGTQEFRDQLQAKFNCCGYFNPCTANSTVALPVCVDPITNFADKILNPVFTSMYATSAIVICLILLSACMISELKLLGRFQKIDEKNRKQSSA
ncbi:hypothetical protein SCHPADRAFT_343592 [Schizopora paradoxa]|uniref:Tetraspanin n=1 Tax=Schizopora paradoxa TaxID=27342 RepID=A0A0H2RPC5_9AGAM|nr:hypothetical protein SCHPADRAFT_343592 [Schizopora paradoxa]